MNKIVRLYDFVFTKVVDRLRSPVLLALRLIVGFAFFQTGQAKVASPPVEFFTKLGLPFPVFTAHFVGYVEMIGGMLLLVGLFSRVTAFALTINMTVAYLTADIESVRKLTSEPDQFLSASPFAYWVVSLVVLMFGPGAFALDWIIRRVVTKKSGGRMAAAAATALLALPMLGAPPAKATFAMGCFWCGESDMEKVSGVLNVISGYTGGVEKNPTYEEVSAGGTGHREAVEVTYDPARVSYEHLLQVFWHNIDPLDRAGQFCDKGDQYRAAIFYHDAAQQKAALASKAAQVKRFGLVVTDVYPASTFYPAEEYHQDYSRKNPIRYHFYRWNCGRDARLKALWGAEAASH